MTFKIVELNNKQGVCVKILNYGAKIMSIKTPDKHGDLGEIVLGYETAEEYLNGNPYFGATVGRCANRISKGKFSLEGKSYALNQNLGENHLHGGPEGFHQVYWEMDDLIQGKGIQSVNLYHTSPDGHEGYPGNLKVKIDYSLNDQNELRIDYEATTDKTTLVNLTHHSFFNLKDGGRSDVLSHFLKIQADKFTPMNEDLIPTGELRLVKNSPLDFSDFHKIGDRIHEKHEQLIRARGYDHNYVLDKPLNVFAMAAEVYEEESGRAMEVYTTQPGMQFYSGNFLDGSDRSSEGFPYQQRSAFCLETQHFPDSPNHQNFPSIVLKAGDCYAHTTVYKFV